MKKLGKLQINSEKIMKNEELLTLRGGYDPLCCMCVLAEPPYTPVGGMVAGGPFECSSLCNYVDSSWTGSWTCS